MITPKSRRAVETLIKSYVAGSLLILAVTAVAKGIGASGDARILSHAEPLLGLFSNRQAMLLAVALELVIIGLVVRERELIPKAVFIAWISTVFVAYRVGLWSIGHQGSCGCLGNVADTLGIAPTTAELVSGAMLAYLLIGSYGILVWKGVLHVRAKRGGPLATAG